MAAINAAPAGDVFGRSELDISLADAAAISERIGAPEEEVRQALNDLETVRAVMHERHLSVDSAVFVLIANVQARRRRDAIVTVPA